MLYSDAEITDVAKEVIQTLADLDIETGLALAALCKAIVMLGTDEDLDNACKMIDEFALGDDDA